MNEFILEQKLKALAKFDLLSKENIERFGNIIQSLDDWNLFRINPLKFATQHNFDDNSAIDIFVHAVKVGLFDFSWNLICPLCGSVEYSHKNLNNLSKSDYFHCILCNKDVKTELDDQVEVSFTLNASINDLKDVDPFRDYDSYRRFYFTVGKN